MNRKKMLYIAAFLVFFTFIGHSVGTLLPQRNQTEAILQTRAMMESTMVEMPFGPSRSISQMAYGGNIFISLYLFISGLFYILAVKPDRYVRGNILLNSVGLGVCAVLSLAFFFPLPAICTALAAIFGFMAAREA